jgi:hypothetical protein
VQRQRPIIYASHISLQQLKIQVANAPDSIYFTNPLGKSCFVASFHDNLALHQWSLPEEDRCTVFHIPDLFSMSTRGIRIFHASVTLLARDDALMVVLGGAHCAFSAVKTNNLDRHQDLRSDHWMVYLRKTRRRCCDRAKFCARHFVEVSRLNFA